VTVVATGYGDQPLNAGAARRDREPAYQAARQADREPHVRRTRSTSLTDLDVPEFVPRS
jgi:hypothetical protein